MKNAIAAVLLAALIVTSSPLPAEAQPVLAPGASRLDTVQVTGTRFGEQVQEVPLSISVISGEDLRARGASDLRTALALLGGVNVASGGDAGPAGAVPGLLGLREVDDFLLLVDGIPAGGAFSPPFEIVSLNNVQRIEVLRGPVPVFYGTTAFAGTINIIHFAAGQADPHVTITYGSRGSQAIQGAMVLSTGAVKQSISGELDHDRFTDERSGVKKALGSYRATSNIGGGQAKIDFNAILLRQKPNSPTPVDDSGQLSTDLSQNFNQNPDNAKLDTNRFQLVLGYDKSLGFGHWGSTVSLTRSTMHLVRGFLLDGFRDATGDNAAGATQSRRLSDVFFDTHLTSKPVPWLDLTYGLNELFGRATQTSQTFTYFVPLDGSTAPNNSAGTGDTPSLQVTRSFFGAYVQSHLRVSERTSLLAGLRWNNTGETRTFSDSKQTLHQSQHNNRPSGSLGGRVQVWRDPEGDLDDVTIHASLGNTFQPPQIDFGPEAGANPLLKAETQRSIEFGIKADGLDGQIDVDLSAFSVDFANQAVAAQVSGLPTLLPGGKERFQGVEVETSYRPGPAWTIAAHASYNDARYRDFSTLINGNAVQLAGYSLPMAPRALAGAGVIFAPARGWRASVTQSFVGRRSLNQLNTAFVGGYAITDASVGYAFARYSIALAGSNLKNRRDPVLASELGEGQFYLQPPRRLLLSVSASFD